MSKKPKKDNKSNVNKYSESMLECATDIQLCVHAYLERGHVNFAALIGTLEHIKLQTVKYADTVTAVQNQPTDSKPPGYVG